MGVQGSRVNLALSLDTACVHSLPSQMLPPSPGKGPPPAVAPRPKASPRPGSSTTIKEKQAPLREVFGPTPPTAQAPPPPPAPPLPLPGDLGTPSAEPRGKEPHVPVRWALLGGCRVPNSLWVLMAKVSCSGFRTLELWVRSPSFRVPAQGGARAPLGPVWHGGTHTQGVALQADLTALSGI